MNRHQLTAIAAIAIGSLFAADTFAVPYASGIRNTTGTTYEFILNEAATDVTVQRSTGGSVALGGLAAGRHTFDLGGASTFDVEVTGSTAAGYNAVDDSSNLFTSFDRPGGLAINTIPTSPYFGTIYVNQNRGEADGANPRAGFGGRTVANGIYSLTADRIGVDLPTFAVPADPNDLTLAKIPDITFGAGSSSSLYRINLDDGGNIIASDWSNPDGGIKYFTADLTSGGNLLRGNNSGDGTGDGPTGGVLSDDMDEFGFIPLHGSVNGEVQVSGTLGVDLVVSAMDEDLDVDLAIVSADDGNSVWEWNVGATIGDFAGAPSLVADVGTLTTAGSATGQDSTGSSVFLNLNIGVTANAQYNAQHNKWYLSGSRSNGNDSSSLVILTPEGAGGDGKDIVVDWASKQFSEDNGLDGFANFVDYNGDAVVDAADYTVWRDSLGSTTDLAADGNGDGVVDDVDYNLWAAAFGQDLSAVGAVDQSQGINDIFRQAHNVSFSPDGTVMFVQRRVVGQWNDFLGDGTGLDNKILAIPLDANGLPDIQIDDNGTPGDTTDDFITNIVAIDTIDNAGSQGSFSQVKVDAAGNVYYSTNVSEAVQYFSLGGDTVATTSNNAALSAGAFAVTGPSSSTSVPEPSTVLLLGLALLSGVARRRS